MDVQTMLLEVSIYASVIVLAILLVRWLLGRRLSPALKYALWFVLIARLLLPVTIDGGVRLFSLPNPVAAESPATVSQAVEPVSTGNTQGAASDGEIAPAATIAAAPESGNAEKKPLTARQIVLIVWLTGAVATGGWMIVSYAVLRQKIRRDAAEPTERLIALFQETKAELRVRGNVRLVCAYTCGAPAMVFPRILFVPLGALICMREDEIRHMLRHELTHDQRGDPAVSVLLAVLCAVYWFHPLVWIAVRLMRADMETACDASVTRRYTLPEKEGYANLLLSLYALPALGAPAMGLSGRGVAKQAQKRVFGVYQARKSAPQGVIAALLVSLLLAFGCFTTACQPAGYSSGNGADQTSPLISDYQPSVDTSGHVFNQNNPWISDIPTRVVTHVKQDTISLRDKVTFAVDADVTEPQNTKPEIVSISRRTINESEFLSMLNAAMPEVKWTMSDKGEGTQLSAVGERNGEPYVAFTDAYSDGSSAFSIYPEELNMIREGYFANDIEMELDYSKTLHQPIPTTAATAKPLADAMVRALGAEGMMLQAAERACRFTSSEAGGETVLTRGWCFVYVPSCGGLPVLYRSGWTSFGKLSPSDYYGEPIDSVLSIYVDDSGVSLVDWRDPFTVSDSLERTEHMMGYDEALASAQELLQSRYDNVTNEALLGQTKITVTAVQLSAAVISDERMSESEAFNYRAPTGTIVPVWEIVCREDSYNSYQESFVLRFTAMDGVRLKRQN
jgi:bla regulator protein BlaR1